MNFSKYASIEQFRNVITSVAHKSRYDGIDSNGEVIHNDNPLPTLTFTGTVKLHGTNAAVGLSIEDEFFCQARKRIITPQDDNHGFAFFAYSRQEMFKGIISQIRTIEQTTDETIIIYGEWCGGNIQNKVGISGLEKMFVIFDIKIISEEFARYVSIETIKQLQFERNQVYSIYDFPTFKLDIDFQDPKLSQNELIKITEAVEKECPVAKYFGKSGCGEGIVWKYYYEDGSCIRFKVKGKKYSVSKVKKLASIDIEKLNTVKSFVESVVTEQRLNQALDEVFRMNNKQITIKGTGDFLRWVVNDIIKEESDTMVGNGLIPKDCNSEISKVARIWFMKYLDTEAGL